MATYTEPRENLQIFDSAVFRETNEGAAGGGLTPAQGDRRYLRFPIAQGTETIASLNTGGVLAITQNGTSGVKILNTQTGSAAQPPITGRTDFFNEDTTGAEVNSVMIDYSGLHTGTLNTINHVSTAMNICPNSVRAAPVNIATGADVTSGCIVNINNGAGASNAGLIRIGKNNLINIDNAANSGNGVVNIGQQSGCQVRIAAGTSQTLTAINIGDGNNQSGTIGIGSGGSSARDIFIASGNGTTNNTTHIGRGNAGSGGIGALQIANSSGATEIKLFPATVTGITTINNADLATGTITIGSGLNSTGLISIGDGNQTGGSAASRNISIGSGAVSGSSANKTISIGAAPTFSGASTVTTTLGRIIGSVGGVTVTSSSSNNQVDLIGAIRLNAIGSATNTLSMSAQGGMSGFIEMGNGNGSTQTISIGNGTGGATSGTITIGGFASGAGKPLVLGSRDIQIGNSTAGTSLVTIAQNTNSLAAGMLGFTTTATIAATDFTTPATNNYQQFATIVAPAYQVSLIHITCQWESREAIAGLRIGAALSATTASNVQVAAGLAFFQEIDTVASAIPQSIQSLSGVYINTTASPITLFLNAQFNQNWVTSAPFFSGSTAITKIG